MALFEGAFHLTANEQSIRDIPQKAKSNLIVDDVADQRSVNTAASFRDEFMTMMPIFERALVLHVGEVAVPFELRNTSDPSRANRQKGKDAERCNEDGTNSSRFVADAPWWGHPMKLDQPGRARRGHDPRQILRIRKESEYPFQGEGNPLFKLEMAGHERSPLMVRPVHANGKSQIDDERAEWIPLRSQSSYWFEGAAGVAGFACD